MTGHLVTGDEKGQQRAHFQWSLLQTLVLLCGPWTVKVYEQLQGVDFSDWGLLPRDPSGLWGILTMPFLHKDFEHIYNNSFGLFILGTGVFFFYPKVAWRVVVATSIAGSTLVWLMARPNYHIGASGVVYGLSAFLFFSGVLRHDRASRGGALIVALLYGGTVWGIFPLQQGVSWEGHLFGALVGGYCAVVFRDVDLPARQEIGDDGMDDAEENELDPYWDVGDPYSGESSTPTGSGGEDRL